MKDINKFTEDEEISYCEEVNNDFMYFLRAIPFIEVSEENEGKTVKLRSSINDNGNVSLGDIFFELQWMLHRYKEKNPELIVDKMIVSKLKLIPISISNALNTIRGFIIIIRYQSHPSIKATLSN